MTTTTATTTTTTAASTPATSNALTQLSANYSDFLTLLTTQLKNQDPSSPLDANQFTQELVAFSGVEQQINTNSNLTSLINLTQANGLLGASNIVGKQVEVQSSQVPLQNGRGVVDFTAPGNETADINVVDANGRSLREVQVSAAAGSNRWAWDGKDNVGNTLADGAYTVVVTGVNADGTTQSLPFTVNGTATGVAQHGSAGLLLNLGSLSVDFTTIKSVN